MAFSSCSVHLRHALSGSGGLYDSRANTCAVLPNFAAYWALHKNLGVGQCASTVEASSEGPSFYVPPSWLPRSFKLIAVKRCPRLKPLCANYFAGTRYAYPNCSIHGLGSEQIEGRRVPLHGDQPGARVSGGCRQPP